MTFRKTLLIMLCSFLSTNSHASANYYDDYSSDESYYDDSSTYYSYSDDYYDNQYPRKKHSTPKKHQETDDYADDDGRANVNSYYSRLPEQLNTHEKVILVDPKVHAWGAYDDSGTLIRAGLATAGSKWCKDLGRPCRTSTGTFRINSMGDSDCYSTKYPLGVGGAPMPYCMYFNGSQGLHGSREVVEGNVSHGCVRLRITDAEWIRYNFAEIGTMVIILPY